MRMYEATRGTKSIFFMANHQVEARTKAERMFAISYPSIKTAPIYIQHIVKKGKRHER